MSRIAQRCQQKTGPGLTHHRCRRRRAAWVFCDVLLECPGALVGGEIGEARVIAMRQSFFLKARMGIAMVLNAGFPWTFPISPNTPSPAAKIRARARPLLVRAFPPLLRPAAVVAMTLAWPVRSFFATRSMINSLPPVAFPTRSRGSLFRAAWWAALRHNIPPLEYFAYRMPDTPDISPSAWFVQTEVPRIAVSLATPEAKILANDKHDFWQFCRDAGLPSIPTLALFGDARDLPRPGAGPLILKPRLGSNARGIELWQDAADGNYRSVPDMAENETLDWPGLCAHAAARRAAGGEDFILQPYLQLHQALRAAIGSGMPAARLVTGLSPSGNVALLSANFARPTPGKIVSNGGAHRTVELASGRLEPARAGQYRSIFSDADLAEDLQGLILPDWHQACQIVVAAHRAFPPRAILLGWDVAFTDEGPVLIEANLGVSLFTEQTDSLIPAGTTPIADLIAAWL